MTRLIPFVVAPLVAILSLAGCNGDPNQTKLQYVPDMADGPTVKSQESYIDPPDGAVAMNALIYPETAEESETLLNMPASIANDPDGVAKGKVLWDTFCISCHGAEGAGDGTLGHEAISPPSLKLSIYADRGDGFYFHRISFGLAIMPGYAHAITPYERWQIVRYIRDFQKEAE